MFAKWAQDEMNHFRVSFNSDTLVECGVKSGLWELTPLDQNKSAWATTYRLTGKGSKILTAIWLQPSGRGHQVLLKGPYVVDLHSITDGKEPGTKIVAFRWEIDWDRASEDLKACLPRFELSGNKTALFRLEGNAWKFVSYLDANGAPTSSDGESSR